MGGPQYGVIADEELQTIAVKHPDSLFIIFDEPRPGAAQWVTEFQSTHFDPSVPERNSLFEFHLTKWPSPDGIVWGIVRIPQAFRPQAEEVAKKYDMRLGPGIPRLSGKDGWEAFPIQDAPNVTSLQGFWKKGHFELDKVFIPRKF